jgi:hypothetical protein
MKYRYLKEGEIAIKTDIAKHKCDCYAYETVAGKVWDEHKVDKICASFKCYRRPIKRNARTEKRNMQLKLHIAIPLNAITAKYGGAA